MKITKKSLKRIVEQGMRYDYGTKKGDTIIGGSPDRDVLKALAFAFTYQVLPDDIPYIVYQPRKKNGKAWLKLEDRDQQLGSMVTSLSEIDAAQYGVTIADVIRVLDMGGAELRKRSPKRYRMSSSIYD